MDKINILFVCHGNICRSPMAEFVLKQMTGEQFHIESAATSREEIGNDIYPPAKVILRERGIPFEKRRARLMTKEDYAAFDYLIGMDDANVRNMLRICGGDPKDKIFRLLDFAGIDRNVSDPWYTGNFEETYRDVVTGCEAFLGMLRKSSEHYTKDRDTGNQPGVI